MEQKKVCKRCGKPFTTESYKQKYCSFECGRGYKTGKFFYCDNCGKKFYRHLSTLKNKSARWCSFECKQKGFKKEKTPAWKGGEICQSNERHVLHPREGYAGNYIGLHRLIAEQAIGRQLGRNEFVIRLNRVKGDNRPENLYICSNSEFSKMRQGAQAFPAKSNLDTYR